MEKQKNIPVLRFPEFDAEWEVKNLRDISEVITKGTTPSKFVDSGINFVKIESFNGNSINPEQCLFIDDEIHNGVLKRSILKEGDVLFAIAGATIGKCNIVPKEILPANTNQALSIIRLLPNENRWYIYFNLTSNRMVKYIKDNIAVGAQPNLNLQQMGDFPCPYPSLPEQQKVASFFIAIDTKISQLKQKKTLLEQYKKGVMQKIFSQEIRFRDDNRQEYPMWEKKRLGEIGKTYNGLSGKSKEHFGSGKPYIQYKQIFDDSKIDITRFDFVNVSEGEKQNKAEYGDIFFTTSSETPDEVGTSSVLLHHVDDLYLNSFCFGYRANHKILNPEFSRYLFRSEKLRKKIVKLAQGSTRYNMSKNELMKTSVQIPVILEQMKIAGLLSSIDTKITHTQTQIDKAELWKKGLLQKMFV